MTTNKEVSLFTDVALESCAFVSGGDPTGNPTIDAQIAAYEQATGNVVVLTPTTPSSSSSPSSSTSSPSASKPLFPLPYQTSAGIVSVQAC